MWAIFSKSKCRVAVTPLHEPLTETQPVCLRGVHPETQLTPPCSTVSLSGGKNIWIRPELHSFQTNCQLLPSFFSPIITLLLPTYSKNETRAKKINKFMKCQANVTIQGWCNTKKSGIIRLSFFPYNQRLQRCFESFVKVDGVHFDLNLNMALPTKIQHITEFMMPKN